MKRTAALLLVCITFLGCSQEGPSYLEIDMSSSKGALIPASASSCKSKRAAELSGETATEDIEGKYFTVRGLKFYWKHAYNSYTVSLIRLKFKHRYIDGEEFSCDIAGDDLEALIDLDPAAATYTPWTGVINPHPDRNYERRVVVETNCDIRCGGIKTDEKSFVAGGRIEVIGFMTAPDGEQTPLKSAASFTIENTQ